MFGNICYKRFAKILQIILRSEFNRLLGLIFLHLFKGLPGFGNNIINALFIQGGKLSFWNASRTISKSGLINLFLNFL